MTAKTKETATTIPPEGQDQSVPGKNKGLSVTAKTKVTATTIPPEGQDQSVPRKTKGCQ